MACDLIPYPLLLKEKGDGCDAAPVRPSLSFRRGTEGEVAGHKHPRFDRPQTRSIVRLVSPPSSAMTSTARVSPWIHSWCAATAAAISGSALKAIRMRSA